MKKPALLTRLPLPKFPTPTFEAEPTPKVRAARARFVATPFWIGVGCTTVLLSILAWGSEYYQLPIAERPLHPKHAALRSSGTIGLSLAIFGTSLMLLNLTYLLRKMVPALHRFGSLRGWMSFHIMTGLVGPAMVVLHTGFLPTSALGTISLTGMLVVVTTGVVGRYIYSRVPRSLAGRELEIDEVKMRLGQYHQALAKFGVDTGKITNLEIAPPNRSLVGAVVALVRGDRALAKQWLYYRDAVLASPQTRSHAREVLPLLRKVVKEGQWLARYHELRSLMGSWRFLHRWLAILMLLLAGFHIYIAVRYGDLWVLP